MVAYGRLQTPRAPTGQVASGSVWRDRQHPATMAMPVSEWAAVTSATCSAMAAAAAWWSVRQGRSQWLAAQSPTLLLQVQDNERESRIELHIANAGSGLAHSLRVCLAHGDEFIEGYAGPNLGGILRPDETRVIATDLAARDVTPFGVVTCIDSVGRVHSFDLAGARRRMRGADSAYGDPIKAFQRHYRSMELPATRVPARALRKTPSP